MHRKLRPLAVTVTEPHPHAFKWNVVELHSESAWSIVETGQKPQKTYHQAMSQGLLALQAMVPDLNTGPRELAKSEGAESDDAHGEEPPPSKPNAFGFGFGLPKYGSAADD